MELNEITGQIIDAALKVHTKLGPGVLESAYEACPAYELRQCGLNVATQVALPVKYGDVELDAGYRIDVFVESRVIVELKAAEKMLPLYEAQLLSYLQLRGSQVGLLLNFNVERMKDGIKRMVI